jgi:hypothetical protein
MKATGEAAKQRHLRPINNFDLWTYAWLSGATESRPEERVRKSALCMYMFGDGPSNRKYSLKLLFLNSTTCAFKVAVLGPSLPGALVLVSMGNIDERKDIFCSHAILVIGVICSVFQ